MLAESAASVLHQRGESPNMKLISVSRMLVHRARLSRQILPRVLDLLFDPRFFTRHAEAESMKSPSLFLGP
jgi:hypothetical protein